MGIVPVAVTLLGAWIIGRTLERRHMGQLALLESGSQHVLAITIEDLPEDWEVESCELVMGNVVISQDYFKRVVAGLKGLVGGNIGVFEPLLERARREALLRMKGVAHRRGYDTVINVRIETSALAQSRSDGKGTAGVEILAFGTAVALRGGTVALKPTEAAKESCRHISVTELLQSPGTNRILGAGRNWMRSRRAAVGIAVLRPPRSRGWSSCPGWGEWRASTQRHCGQPCSRWGRPQPWSCSSSPTPRQTASPRSIWG